MIKRQKPNAFAWDKESALTIALREIRTSANDLVDSKAVDVPVKELLQKQSNLYRAIDEMAPKAAMEAQSALWRLWQKVKNALGLRWQILAGSGLVTGWIVAPWLVQWILMWAGWWLLWVQAIKALLSPTVRKWLWQVLIKIDDVIKKTPNPDLFLLKEEIEDLLSE